MKTSILLIAIGLLMFTACKKENASQNNNHGMVTANIGGYSFTSNTINSSESTYPTFIDSNYTFDVDAEQTGDWEILRLNLTSLQPGTYQYSNLNPSGTIIGSFIEYLKGEKVYCTVTPSGAHSPGAIIITSSTSKGISGTFSGTLYYQYVVNGDSTVITNDSVVITNGVFTNLN